MSEEELGAEQEIGVVTHYFSRIGVGAIRLIGGTLRLGDSIHILGHTTDLEQVVESMEIEHQLVTEAQTGQEVGIRVLDHVRDHDKVFKVIE
ncbi:MAG: hypothetical protein M5U22_09785 [Thermoleophilia bacterium]|nr:hypothetical protein [Thermoleophilia bacterium]